MGESLLEKAAQCRRFAAMIINQNDPAVVQLLALAEEFEAKAKLNQANAKQDQAAALQNAVDKVAANEAAPDTPIAAMKPPEEQPEC